MIVFDLKCSVGHTFEGWFDDLDHLEDQLARGLVTCPSCGDAQVCRTPSSFAVKRSSPRLPEQQAAQVLGQAFRRYIQDNFEDVGTGFAKEALKIHYGASEPRNIRGVSSPQEEKVLQDEGVSFFKFTPDSDGPKDAE